MSSLRTTGFAVLCSGLFAAVVPAASPADSVGVLVMAHGGSPSWNAAVLEAVAALRSEHPLEVAFGMADACSLRDAVRQLESTGVSDVAVVRLFVSGDSFLERTEQILGIRAGAPAAAPTDCSTAASAPSAHAGHSMALFQVPTNLRFAVSSEGLADAPEMGAILADRARALSRAPAREEVVILAHGPGDDAENERWIAALEARAEAIREALPFHHVEVRTLREDWPEKRKTAEAELKASIARTTAAGRTAIVIPFRVQGFGPYAAVLEGLEYTSDGTGLLPHPRVGDWIARQVRELSALLATRTPQPGRTAGLAPARAGQTPAEPAHDSEQQATPSAPKTYLERITVTATAGPRELGDVAGGVSVITRDEIELLQMHDARDLLAFEPGVYVENNGARLGLGGFVVRGIGGNRVQTQIDGIPTAEEFEFGPLAAQRTTLDIEALESAEIVRGPASSLYGSDALGGIVALVTREPSDYLRDGSPYWGARVGHDSASDETLGSISLARGGSRWQSSLALHGSAGDALSNQGTNEDQGTLRTAPNPQERTAFGGLAKLNTALSDRADLRVALEGSRSDATTEAYSLRAPVSGIPTLDFDADDTARRVRGSLTLLTQLTSRFGDTLSVRAHYQDARAGQRTTEVRRRASGDSDRHSAFDFEQQTLGADVQLRKGFQGPAEHLVTYGLAITQKRFDQLRRQVDISRTTGTALPSALPHPTKYFPQSEVGQLGVFVQDDIGALGGRLRLVPGLRYDRSELRPDRDDAIFHSGNPGTPQPNDATNEAFSPKLGAVFAASDRVSLTAQYAHGFRTPPYSDVNQGFTNLAFGYTALSNPDLRPETSDTFELGVRGRAGRTSWSLNAFESRYDDFIEFATLGTNPGTGLLEFQSRNVTTARIRGVELGADGRLATAWRWRLSGAWTEGTNRAIDQPLNTIAPPAVSAGLFYNPAGRIDGALVVKHWLVKEAGELDRSVVNQFATPAATAVDVSVGWAIVGDLSMRLGVANVLDETYWQWGDVQGIAATSTVLERYSSPGRSAVATLRWRR